jgi:hypothetical protein
MDTEEFEQKSWYAIWELVNAVRGYAEELDKLLPFRLTFFAHHDDERGDITFSLHSLEPPKLQLDFWASPLSCPPEPAEMYPSPTLAVCSVRMSRHPPVELYRSANGWVFHSTDRWLPFSQEYLSFLIGEAIPDDTEEHDT